ncbi:MAG TPA: hypothetical protein V6D14_25340 [Coleofasciculaceae cyanobacterium]
MTDHLEPYRRMARSIKFFPPLSLTQPSQESVVEPVTPLPISVSSSKSLAQTQEISEEGPPIDPSEHIAALVHEAVSKPTVLPISHAFLENIGDRISRLTTPKPVELPLIQPKMPQPDPNWTSAQGSPAESAIDLSEHTAALVHEAVSKPTVLPNSYTILEDIGDRISRLTTPAPVDTDAIPPQIPQPESVSIPAPTIEPQPMEGETKKSIDDAHPEASTSATVVAEAPIVEEVHSDDSAVGVVEPLEVEEKANETSVMDAVESAAVKETIDDKAATVVSEPIEVAKEPSDEPAAVVTESVELEDTTDHQAAATVVAESVEVEEKPNNSSDNNTPADVATEAVAVTDTTSEDIPDANTSVAEAEDEKSPTLLQRVSSVIEAVSTAFKNQDADQTDSEPVEEPSPLGSAATESPTNDTLEPLTPDAPVAEAEDVQAPSLLERISSVVEAVTTTLKDSDVDKKNSEVAVEPVPAVDEQLSDTKVETSKVTGSQSDTAVSDSTSKSAKSQSKKKTKAKGFGSAKGK